MSAKSTRTRFQSASLLCVLVIVACSSPEGRAAKDPSQGVATVELGHVGPTMIVDGFLYHFQRFEFQFPSKHRIDDAPSPLEMQMLYARPGEDGASLTICVLFREGRLSPFLYDLYSHVPNRGPGIARLDRVYVDAGDILDADDRYLTQVGRTRVCVLSRVEEASHRKIEEFRRVEPQRLTHIGLRRERRFELLAAGSNTPITRTNP